MSRLAKLCHVGKQRHSRQTLGESPEHLGRVERLRKNRVCPGFEREFGSVYCAIDSLACGAIRPGHDREVAARFYCCGPFRCHVARIRQFLVIEMPTLLGQTLVLNLNCSGARILEDTYDMHSIEDFAESGVTVDQDRQLTPTHTR